MSLLERNRELARRCGDLSPIAPAVRDILWRGNRDVIMAGVSPGSTRLVAPLRPWAGPPPTYPGRKGSGPIRAPHGEASRVVAGCVVSVQAGVGRLSVTKSWPSLGDIAMYLNDGTPKMVGRPFFGYRAIDLEHVRGLMREYVIPRGIVSRIGALFGR